MTYGKCEKCHRHGDCALQDLAVLTLPWVQKARRCEGCERSEWDISHDVRRALRGTGRGSPGFVEDWLFDGAFTQEDVSRLINAVIRCEEITVGMLTRGCRHYVGPQIPQDDDFSDASAA